MVFIISIRLANRSPRNALFIGGAVGLGFGAIEDMSYELRAWDYPDYLHHVTPLWSIVKLTGERDLFGWLHPTFTALLAVALFAMMRQPRVKTILAFVGLYLLLAAAHGLYDYIDFVNFGHLSASTMANVLLVIRGVINIGGIVAWFLVARRNRIRPASGIVTPDVALT
jgi:RsiW-degrading membrane proteinase PrsW (M82 family)